MKPFSIARRLLAWLTLSIIVFWIAASGLGTYVMHEEFGEIFDSSMQQTAERLLPLVLDDLGRHDLRAAPLRLQKSGVALDEYLTYQVRDAAGRVLMHSYDTPSLPFKAPLTPGFWQDDRARIFTAAAENNAIFVQVADSLAHRIEATQDGAIALFVPVFVLVPLNVIVLLLIVRSATLPLTALRRTIAEKDGGNLSPVPLEGLPQELRPIANSLNLVLTRLSDTLNAEREFTANSAHELRTPIAGAMAQTQMLLGELGRSEARGRALLIEQSLQRLGFLTEKLLQLSRAEAGIGPSETLHDLVPVIELVVEDFRRQVGLTRQIDFANAAGIRLVRGVNPDAFAIALRNLIENAVLHGGDQQPIVVRIVSEAEIVVSNAAKLYTPTELRQFRERFVRGDDLSLGSGLGLSIADRLLTQMNASLELRSSTRGDDTIFEAIIRF